MEEYIEKIERNAKAIKTIISLLIIVLSLVYGFCIFIYQSKNNAELISELKIEVVENKKNCDSKYKVLEERISQNERNFQMTSTKLDVSLTRISTDLQFIKEHLLRKGLDK